MASYSRGSDWYSGKDQDSVYPSRARFVPAKNHFIEVWSFNSGDIDIVEGDLEPTDVPEWLSQKGPVDSAYRSDEVTGGVRLILSLTEMLPGWRDVYAFEEATLQKAMKEFNLPISYVQGAMWGFGCYCRNSLSELAGNAPDSSIGFVIEHMSSADRDHDLVFTWDAQTNITQGLLRVTSQLLLDQLLKGLRSLKTLAIHPLSLAYVSLESRVLWTSSDLGEVHKNITQFQMKTGHVGAMFIMPDEAAYKPSDQYDILSMEISNISQAISGQGVWAKSSSHLGRFILESGALLQAMIGPPDYRQPGQQQRTQEVFQKNTRILGDLVRTGISKCDHHVDIIEHYQKLCSIQNQTVYNLIAQRDVRQNIEIAKDSKSIAQASKRDSSAMKSISLLTMVVLPGTFISTLFAVPLFNWDAETWHEVPKSRFWFYWAITLPLTFGILIAWTLWERFDTKQKMKLDEAAREQVMVRSATMEIPPKMPGGSTVPGKKSGLEQVYDRGLEALARKARASRRADEGAVP